MNQEDRFGLERELPAIVPFCAAHLEAGRTVLVACPDGRERSAAAAAALLACSCGHGAAAGGGEGEAPGPADFAFSGLRPVRPLLSPPLHHLFRVQPLFCA